MHCYHALVHGMNWDDLRLLLAVHRSGSLSGAARILGVNQSTISRRLIAFEAKLKTKLVERRPEGAVLTEAGQEFCTLAEKTEADLHLTVGSLADTKENISGPLSIACVDMMVDRFLAPHLAQFQTEHPKIEISVLAGLDAVDLIRGKADIALRVSRGPDQRLTGKRLCQFGLGIYKARDSSDEGKSNGWIGWVDERHIEAMIPDHLRALEVVHYADSFLVMNAMVRSGMGIAVLPCYWADADQAMCRVVPEPVSYPDLGIWILYHPDRKQLPRVRAFIEFISQKFIKNRDTFSGLNVLKE
ncbi:MAG: LysR family transcriptional regulator [Boseongicola sp.]|nr:MAG: LysR family transcriptional regulator [Boseongicola sp.]